MKMKEIIKRNTYCKQAQAWMLSVSMCAGRLTGYAPLSAKEAKAAQTEMVNLAEGKEAYASSSQGVGTDGEKVVDGDTTTHWESAWSEDQSWIWERKRALLLWDFYGKVPTQLLMRFLLLKRLQKIKITSNSFSKQKYA